MSADTDTSMTDESGEESKVLLVLSKLADIEGQGKFDDKKCRAVLDLWDEFSTINPDLFSSYIDIFKRLAKIVSRTILGGLWAKLRETKNERLRENTSRVQRYLERGPGDAKAHCDAISSLLDAHASPWTKPTVQAIMNSKDDESSLEKIDTLLKEEGWMLIQSRLETLTGLPEQLLAAFTEACVLIAQAQSTSDAIDSSDTFHHLPLERYYEILTLFCVIIARKWQPTNNDLLHRKLKPYLTQPRLVIEVANRLLQKEQTSRLQPSWKGWKSCQDLCLPILEMAMINCNESEVEESDLNHVFQLCLSFHYQVKRRPSNGLPLLLKIVQPADTPEAVSELEKVLPEKLNFLCETAVRNEYAYKYGDWVVDFYGLNKATRAKCVDLYLSRISVDVSKLLTMKEFEVDKDDEQEERKIFVQLNQSLGTAFNSIAKYFTGNPQVTFEIRLTAFSLNPTQEGLDILRQMTSDPNSPIDLRTKLSRSHNEGLDLPVGLFTDFTNMVFAARVNRLTCFRDSIDNFSEMCQRHLSTGGNDIRRRSQLDLAKPTDYTIYEGLQPAFDEDDMGYEAGYLPNEEDLAELYMEEETGQKQNRVREPRSRMNFIYSRRRLMKKAALNGTAILGNKIRRKRLRDQSDGTILTGLKPQKRTYVRKLKTVDGDEKPKIRRQYGRRRKPTDGRLKTNDTKLSKASLLRLGGMKPVIKLINLKEQILTPSDAEPTSEAVAAKLRRANRPARKRKASVSSNNSADAAESNQSRSAYKRGDISTCAIVARQTAFCNNGKSGIWPSSRSAGMVNDLMCFPQLPTQFPVNGSEVEGMTYHLSASLYYVLRGLKPLTTGSIEAIAQKYTDLSDIVLANQNVQPIHSYSHSPIVWRKYMGDKIEVNDSQGDVVPGETEKLNANLPTAVTNSVLSLLLQESQRLDPEVAVEADVNFDPATVSSSFDSGDIADSISRADVNAELFPSPDPDPLNLQYELTLPPSSVSVAVALSDSGNDANYNSEIFEKLTDILPSSLIEELEQGAKWPKNSDTSSSSIAAVCYNSTMLLLGDNDSTITISDEGLSSSESELPIVAQAERYFGQKTEESQNDQAHTLEDLGTGKSEDTFLSPRPCTYSVPLPLRQVTNETFGDSEDHNTDVLKDTNIEEISTKIQKTNYTEADEINRQDVVMQTLSELVSATSSPEVGSTDDSSPNPIQTFPKVLTEPWDVEDNMTPAIEEVAIPMADCSSEAEIHKEIVPEPVSECNPSIEELRDAPAIEVDNHLNNGEHQVFPPTAPDESNEFNETVIPDSFVRLSPIPADVLSTSKRRRKGKRIIRRKIVKRKKRREEKIPSEEPNNSNSVPSDPNLAATTSSSVSTTAIDSNSPSSSLAATVILKECTVRLTRLKPEEFPSSSVPSTTSASTSTETLEIGTSPNDLKNGKTKPKQKNRSPRGDFHDYYEETEPSSGGDSDADALSEYVPSDDEAAYSSDDQSKRASVLLSPSVMKRTATNNVVVNWPTANPAIVKRPGTNSSVVRRLAPKPSVTKKAVPYHRPSVVRKPIPNLRIPKPKNDDSEIWANPVGTTQPTLHPFPEVYRIIGHETLAKNVTEKDVVETIDLVSSDDEGDESSSQSNCVLPDDGDNDAVSENEMEVEEPKIGAYEVEVNLDPTFILGEDEEDRLDSTFCFGPDQVLYFTQNTARQGRKQSFPNATIEILQVTNEEQQEEDLQNCVSNGNLTARNPWSRKQSLGSGNPSPVSLPVQILGEIINGTEFVPFSGDELILPDLADSDNSEKDAILEGTMQNSCDDGEGKTQREGGDVEAEKLEAGKIDLGNGSHSNDGQLGTEHSSAANLEMLRDGTESNHDCRTATEKIETPFDVGQFNTGCTTPDTSRYPDTCDVAKSKAESTTADFGSSFDVAGSSTHYTISNVGTSCDVSQPNTDGSIDDTVTPCDPTTEPTIDCTSPDSKISSDAKKCNAHYCSPEREAPFDITEPSVGCSISDTETPFDITECSPADTETPFDIAELKIDCSTGNTKASLDTAESNIVCSSSDPETSCDSTTESNITCSSNDYGTPCNGLLLARRLTQALDSDLLETLSPEACEDFPKCRPVVGSRRICIVKLVYKNTGETTDHGEHTTIAASDIGGICINRNTDEPTHNGERCSTVPSDIGETCVNENTDKPIDDEEQSSNASGDIGETCVTSKLSRKIDWRELYLLTPTEQRIGLRLRRRKTQTDDEHEDEQPMPKLFRFDSSTDLFEFDASLGSELDSPPPVLPCYSNIHD